MTVHPHAVPATAPGSAPADELMRLIRSRFSLVYVDTHEEARAERIIAGAARACGRATWSWTISSGLEPTAQTGGVSGTSDPEAALRHIAEHSSDDVFVMCDLARHVQQDPKCERLLRDIAKDTNATIVLLGPHDAVPHALSHVAAEYQLERPDVRLIDAHLRSRLATAGREHGIRHLLDEPGMADLAAQLRGLTLEQVDQVLLHLLHDDGVLDSADLARAASAKARLLAAGGVVTLEAPTHGLEWVAGFQHVKDWVETRSRAFEADAVAFGIRAPRGLLLTGVPGCGKSFVAKAIAHTWRMPLLRLDAGSLYDSFIGASERNLREALATAGAIAPSVLWIDEIEKGFGSTGPSESDGGLAYRLLGTLATWMQERPHPVFLIATSNDITKLPPELTRQGRFDETFFIDLPPSHVREHLYRLQFARIGRPHERFDCATLAAATDGFSGAEIEQSVTNALYAAFAAGRELTTDDVAREVAATRPLSVVRPGMIDAIRRWGAMHARPA